MANGPMTPKTDTSASWGGGLRKDWPPEEGSIITCPSCEMRHGRRYMCDARMLLVQREERR